MNMDVVAILNLSDFEQGALQEAFDYELARVAANLVDPNTSDKAREITIKISFTRNEGMTAVETSFGVSSKIQPQAAGSSTMLIGRRGGKVTLAPYAVAGDQLPLLGVSENA